VNASELGRQIFDETVIALKGEYAALPQTVKDIMPKAAVLIAGGLVGLGERDKADFKHAMAIMGNVKVGGQIALNDLMLTTASNILTKGLGVLRSLIGL
jgi:hypothetical protein